jgi:hypothetical protein
MQVAPRYADDFYNDPSNFYIHPDDQIVINNAMSYKVPEYDIKAFLPLSKCPWPKIDVVLCCREFNCKFYWYCLYYGYEKNIITDTINRGEINDNYIPINRCLKYIWLTHKGLQEITDRMGCQPLYLYDEIKDCFMKNDNIFFLVSIKGYKLVNRHIKHIRGYLRKFDNIFNGSLPSNMDARTRKFTKKIYSPRSKIKRIIHNGSGKSVQIVGSIAD